MARNTKIDNANSDQLIKLRRPIMVCKTTDLYYSFEWFLCPSLHLIIHSLTSVLGHSVIPFILSFTGFIWVFGRPLPSLTFYISQSLINRLSTFHSRIHSSRRTDLLTRGASHIHLLPQYLQLLTESVTRPVTRLITEAPSHFYTYTHLFIVLTHFPIYLFIYWFIHI